MHAGALAAITWDPFIRGLLIVVVGFLVFPGSVYLLLSMNTGVRVGFLLAAAALTGWMFVLAVVWAVFGIGDIGRANSWKVLQVVTGDFSSQNTVSGVGDFPTSDAVLAGLPGPKAAFTGGSWRVHGCSDDGKWHRVDRSRLGDIQAAADKDLVPSTEAAPKTGPRFTAPFGATSDYVPIDGYEKGTDGSCLFAIGRHKFYLSHSPHYVIDRVLPALPVLSVGGPPPAPVPDRSKPYTYVAMVRDLGSLRQPPIVIAGVCLTLFAVICFVLHQRDKEILAAKVAAEAAGGPRARV